MYLLLLFSVYSKPFPAIGGNRTHEKVESPKHCQVCGYYQDTGLSVYCSRVSDK